MNERMPAGPRPLPSMFRVAWLVIAFALRRVKNRLSARRNAGKRLGVGRTGTARKKPMGSGFVIGLSAIFLFNCVLRTTTIVRELSLSAERVDAARHGQYVVRSHVLTAMHAEERVSPLLSSADQDLARRGIERLLSVEAHERRDLSVADSTSLFEQFRRRFAERGSAGFRETQVGPLAFLPDPEIWYGSPSSLDMLIPLGLIALLLGTATVLASIVGTNQELSKVEWSLEWWFTFPVPARGLLLARVLETAFASPLVWLLLLPFFASIFCCAGLGWGSIPLGFLAMVCVGLCAGSLRVLAETSLRKWLSLRNVARIQAVLSVFATLPFVAVVAATIPEFLARLVLFAHRLPPELLYNALNPIGIAAGGRASTVTALTSLGTSLAVALAATTLGGWLLRDGLTTGGGIQGTRGSAARNGGAARGLLGVVARNELRAVLRDRTRFMQAFVSPALVLALQLFTNRSFFSGLATHPQHAAAVAFGTAAFVLSTGGCNSLVVDAPALWLYFTVPRSLERVLLEKAYFWAGLASLIVVAVFFTVSARTPGALLAAAPLLALALLGAVIYAFVATSIGALGTNALETEPTRRVQVSMVYLFMLLASMFTYALYAPSWWTKLAQVVLSSLLAFALLQKVRDHTPYLLDPNAEPPPSIAVADGVIAALAFFVLQGLLGLLFGAMGYSPGASLLFAFAGAGVLAATGIVLVFWQSRLPHLFQSLGLRAPEQGWLRAIFTGLVGGIVGSAVASGYLLVVQRVTFLRELRDHTVSLAGSNASVLPWLAVLAILAAPVFEELIFRGVLFSGFRRSLGPVRAAFASAAVFAIVHPPIAAAPVFVLGLIAAAAYHRSRSLVTPMIVHATYNALVFIVGSHG